MIRICFISKNNHCFQNTSLHMDLWSVSMYTLLGWNWFELVCCIHSFN